MATSDSTPDLDPKVAQAIQDAVDALRAELLGHLKPQAISAPPARVAGDSLNRLESAVEAIDSAATQTGLLASLLQEAGAFAERSMFLVREGDDLKGWAAFGFSAADDDVSRVNVACTSEITNRRPENDPAASGAICDRMAAVPATESIMVPFTLRGKVAGALYADCTPDGGALDRPALRILSYVAAQAVETLPLRRVSEPAAAVTAVESPVESPAESAIESPAEEAPPASQVQAPDEMAAEDEVATDLDTQGAAEIEAALDAETDSEVDVDVERMIEEVASEKYGEDSEADIVAIRHDVSATGFEAVDEDRSEAEVEESPESGGFETAVEEAVEEVEEIERETPEEAEEETHSADTATMDAATVEAGGADVAEPVEVEPPERAIDDTEVAPPADLDGPGWAFSGGESISDDTRHEEARRLARLLVTEIKLYNEEKVREGRETNELYDKLRDDLERSRRIYEERIDDEVREEGDYFQEEVVRILAGGDSTALGV